MHGTKETGHVLTHLCRGGQEAGEAQRDGAAPRAQVCPGAVGQLRLRRQRRTRQVQQLLRLRPRDEHACCRVWKPLKLSSRSSLGMSAAVSKGELCGSLSAACRLGTCVRHQDTTTTPVGFLTCTWHSRRSPGPTASWNRHQCAQFVRYCSGQRVSNRKVHSSYTEAACERTVAVRGHLLWQVRMRQSCIWYVADRRRIP